MTASNAIHAISELTIQDPEISTAIQEQETRAIRLTKETGIAVPEAMPTETANQAQRLRSAGECLETLVRNQERLIEAAQERERALTEQIQILSQLQKSGKTGELKDLNREFAGAKTVRLTDAPVKEAVTSDTDVKSIERLVAYGKQQAAALANVTAERDLAKKNLAAVTNLLRAAQTKIEELRDAKK